MTDRDANPSSAGGATGPPLRRPVPGLRARWSRGLAVLRWRTGVAARSLPVALLAAVTVVASLAVDGAAGTAEGATDAVGLSARSVPAIGLVGAAWFGRASVVRWRRREGLPVAVDRPGVRMVWTVYLVAASLVLAMPLAWPATVFATWALQVAAPMAWAAVLDGSDRGTILLRAVLGGVSILPAVWIAFVAGLVLLLPTLGLAEWAVDGWSGDLELLLVVAGQPVGFVVVHVVTLVHGDLPDRLTVAGWARGPSAEVEVATADG